MNDPQITIGSTTIPQTPITTAQCLRNLIATLEANKAALEAENKSLWEEHEAFQKYFDRCCMWSLQEEQRAAEVHAANAKRRKEKP